MSKRGEVFQQFLLCHFAGTRRLTVLDLAQRTLPARLDAAQANAWRTEIEIACELMVLRGLLSTESGAGGKIYVTTERARSLLSPPVAEVRNARAVPFAAAALIAACASHPAGAPSGDGPGRVRSYHEGSKPQPLARMEQFAAAGGTVYRVCLEDCPGPTPKRLAQVSPAAVQSRAAPANTQNNNTTANALRTPDSLNAAVVETLQGWRMGVVEVAAKILGPALLKTSLPATADSAPPAHIADDAMQTQTRSGSVTDADTLSPRDFLNGWASAWAARDVEAYLRLYAADFVAPDGMRAAAWQARRAGIMKQAGNIEVALEITSVRVAVEHATLTFWQRYRSPAFRSRVLKSIDLVKQRGSWKIRAERVVAKV